MPPQDLAGRQRATTIDPLAPVLAQLLNTTAVLRRELAALQGALVRHDSALLRTMQSVESQPAATTGRTLYATFLGSFAVYRNDERLLFGRNRAVLELGRYLIARAGRVVSRDELIELLWPDSDIERTNHRLHVAVSGLRQILDPPGSAASVVQYDDDRYAIEAVVTDCELFERHYQRGRQLLNRHENEVATGAFRDALDLYNGDYLADHPYAEWTFQPRSHFVERRLSTLTLLCEQAERVRDFVSMLEYAQQIVVIDNLREQAHRAVMRAHYAIGQRACAMRQYTTLAKYLASELGVRPSRATERLYRAICTDGDLPDSSSHE